MADKTFAALFLCIFLLILVETEGRYTSNYDSGRDYWDKNKETDRDRRWEDHYYDAMDRSSRSGSESQGGQIPEPKPPPQPGTFHVDVQAKDAPKKKEKPKSASKEALKKLTNDNNKDGPADLKLSQPQPMTRDSKSEPKLEPNSALKRKFGVKSLQTSSSSEQCSGMEGPGTKGGNANGRSCCFPFIHKGFQEYQCIYAPRGPWCGTTDNYDTDRQWGECEEPFVPKAPANTTAKLALGMTILALVLILIVIVLVWQRKKIIKHYKEQKAKSEKKKKEGKGKKEKKPSCLKKDKKGKKDKKDKKDKDKKNKDKKKKKSDAEAGETEPLIDGGDDPAAGGDEAPAADDAAPDAAAVP